MTLFLNCLLSVMGFLSIGSWAHAQSQTVNFAVNIPAHTPPNSQFFLTGGPELGCNWQPTCRPLKVIDQAGRTVGVQFTVPIGLRAFPFKISRGNWKTEAADPAGRALENQIVVLNGRETTHVFNVINWFDLGSLGVTGKVIRLDQVYSPQLKNYRDVYVWVPASYLRNRQKRYPVIYMHDGQNLFDPRTSAFGVDWDVDQTMTRLARRTGQEAIVVGVSSQESRTRFEEYDYTMKGSSYAQFLIESLKPKIDSMFQTLPGRESTFVAGSSMGGHISMALVWVHSDVFSKALAFSLPAFIHEGSIFNVINKLPKPSLPIQVYIDHGGWGGDKDYKPSVTNFLNTLLSRGLRKDQIVYAQFQFHDHTEADWARRLENPIQWLLK